MRSAILSLCLATVFLALTGCIPEDLGGGLDIVNQTEQPLYLYDTQIDPEGDRWRYEISECSDSDLALRAEDGEVFAELEDEWCPGQTWTITGENESTLEDR